MTNIVVLDDSLEIRTTLDLFLKQYAKERNATFSISLYDRGLPFLKQYNHNVDVVFFDIDLPDSNGMELAKQIREKDKKVIIVFVTNLARYALNGYEVEALDFIIKPIEYGAFKMKMDRIMSELSKKENRFISIKTVNDGVLCLNLSDVAYVEALGHNIIFHTSSDSYRYSTSLAKIKTELGDSGFEKCSNSYLVNLKFVRQVTLTDVILTTSSMVPISRSMRKDFMKKLANYYGA